MDHIEAAPLERAQRINFRRALHAAIDASGLPAAEIIAILKDEAETVHIDDELDRRAAAGSVNHA